MREASPGLQRIIMNHVFFYFNTVCQMFNCTVTLVHWSIWEVCSAVTTVSLLSNQPGTIDSTIIPISIKLAKPFTIQFSTCCQIWTKMIDWDNFVDTSRCDSICTHLPSTPLFSSPALFSNRRQITNPPHHWISWEPITSTLTSLISQYLTPGPTLTTPPLMVTPTTSPAPV